VTAIVGAPVNVKGQQVNPQTGIPIPDAWASPQTNTSDTAVATIYTMPDGSKVYGYVDTYGKHQYAEVPPWADGVTARQAGDGSVTMTVKVGGAYFDPKGSVIATPYLNTPGDLETVHKSTMAAWMSGAGKITKELPSVSSLAVRSAIKTESGSDFVTKTITGADGKPTQVTTYNQDVLDAIAEVDSLKADYLNADPNAALVLANERQNFSAEYQDTLRGALGSRERGVMVAKAQEGQQDLSHQRDLAALRQADTARAPRFSAEGRQPLTAERAQELLGHPLAPSAAQKAASVAATQQAGGKAVAAFLQGQMQGGMLTIAGAPGTIFAPVRPSSLPNPRPLVGPTGNTTPSTFYQPPIMTPGQKAGTVPPPVQPPPPTPPPAYKPPTYGTPGGASGYQPGEPVAGKTPVPYRPPSSGSTSTGRVGTR
jgi:hypothetical protein